MNFKEFKQLIVYYMSKRGWTTTDAIDGSNRLALEKNFNPDFTKKQKNKFLLNDTEFYKKLKEGLDKLNVSYKNFNSINNEYGDTDFIIAGLQTINPFMNNLDDDKINKWCSFQPVVRLNGKDICGIREGYFTSFVNVCEIDTNTSFIDYLQDVDNWIDILSNCSLHTSGLQLILKPSTTAYNGVGIEFNYKGIELGQANLYLLNINNEKRMVSDFGFGYERILWAINGGKNFFAPFVSKYDYLFGDLQEVDRIRTVTLMTMSGMKPSSTGKGKHIRSLIKDSFDVIPIGNVDDQIERYYNFYSKFIIPNIELEKVKDMIKCEIDFSRKRKLLNKLGISNYSPLMNKSIEEVCERVFLNELQSSSNNKFENKEKEVRKR